MSVSVDKKASHCDELQKAKDLYRKINRALEKVNDVKVKRKKDGRLYVYEEKLQLAE